MLKSYKYQLHPMAEQKTFFNKSFGCCRLVYNWGLALKNMMQNHKLAKSIAEVCWGRFIEILKYKADWLGKNVIVIGRYEPSSKLCSNCGYRHSDLKLSDRHWECPSCGVRHDRDFNAAVNIKRIGLGGTEYSPTAGGFNGRGGGGFEFGEASKFMLV